MSHSIKTSLVIILHSFLHVGLKQVLDLKISHFYFLKPTNCLQNYLRLQFIGSNTSPNLHEENNTQKNCKGEGHAMVLLDGSTATKEGDKEDDTSDNDEEDGGREELISQKVKILTVGSLHHSSYHNEKQTWELEIFHNLSLF